MSYVIAARQSRFSCLVIGIEMPVACSCAVNPLPSDEVRKALGERIGLTAHQVQVLIRCTTINRTRPWGVGKHLIVFGCMVHRQSMAYTDHWCCRSGSLIGGGRTRQRCRQRKPVQQPQLRHRQPPLRPPQQLLMLRPGHRCLLRAVPHCS